jgi:thioredoxin reductase
VRARRIVLATGVVDELPAIPGLWERWGATVLHCPYCHGYEVADGRLGVLATGERSLHLALLLPDWSADVTLFTNGAVALDVAQREALSARGVRVDERAVEALVGDTPALTGIRLQRGVVVPLDALFTGFRTRIASPLAEQLGCMFDDGPVGQIIRTDERMETSVPGVFAAGDVARAFANATLAAADGVMAGTAAHQSLALPHGHASHSAARQAEAASGASAA